MVLRSKYDKKRKDEQSFDSGNPLIPKVYYISIKNFDM